MSRSKTNAKKDNSIRVILLNVNGINMSKIFNHKADRLNIAHPHIPTKERI